MRKQVTYKHTELGLLPSHWEVKRLEEIGDIDKNSLNNSTNENYEFEYVSLSDVDCNDFEITTTKQIFKTAPSRARRIVQQNDILFATVRPNLQGFSIIRNNVVDLIASTGFAVITSTNAVNEFLFQCLFSSFTTKQITLLLVGTNYPAINSSDVKKLKLPIPPLPEQQRIATIFSTWDKAIDNCKLIIEKLQVRNKGLAQQLLTGKKRVKGFEKSKWSRLNADEVFINHSQKNNSQSEVLLSATQDRGMIPRDMLEGRVTMPTGETNSYKLVEKSDFVISLRSFQGGLEYSEYRGLVSPAYTVLKPKHSIVSNFYKYYFKSYNFIGRLSIAVVGIRDGKNISYETFSTILIPNPSLQEQHQIATILDTATTELKTYQQKLAQLQLQKKGLMQQLLTGKVLTIKNA